MEKGKPKNKYLNTVDRHRLYLTCVEPAMFADTTMPIVFVEAEKSALMLASVARRTGRRICAIAMGGCWGWRGKIGNVETPDGGHADEKGPVPDWDLFSFEGRTVIIWLDSNVATNSGVSAARYALVREIKRRGGLPKTVVMPSEEGVNGPDDFRRRHDDAAVLHLMDSATSAGVYTNAHEYLEASGLRALTNADALDAAESALKNLSLLLRDETNPVTLAMVREGAVAALKKIGIRCPAGVVDAALRIRTATDEGPQWLVDDAPATEPVEPALLLEQLVSIIRKYVIVSPEAARAIALWVMVSWAQASALILPLLYS